MPDVPYTDEQLAKILYVKLDVFRRVLASIPSDMVTRDLTQCLVVMNWSNYQTEYERQKGYRTKLHPRVTPQKSEVRSQKSEEQKQKSDKDSASASPDAPADESSTASTDSRTFAQQCVDRALVSYEKRYCLTRQLTAYPGGPKALAKGYGVVVETLAGFCPDFPKTKAQTAAKTEKELKHIASVVQTAWVQYLENAAAIDESAKSIPGKDRLWLQFPPTVVRFCGRIPQLSQADVEATAKRVADVTEAKRNFKRSNPDSGPSIRYGDRENVIP